jgi:hypothetical protein
MIADCDREQDVLDAITSQRWPTRCDEDLQAHVRTCSFCADLVEVASALLDEHASAHQEARIPSSGIVWWRAQLRARDEDARAAARPIAFVQGIAASVAVWLLVTFIRAVPAATFVAWKDWVLGFMPHVSLPVPSLAHVAAAIPVGVLVVVGAALLLAPLAIYFAVAED